MSALSATAPSRPRIIIFVILSLFLTTFVSFAILLTAMLWEHEGALNRLEHALVANEQSTVLRVLPLFERGAAKVDKLSDWWTWGDQAPGRQQFRQALYDVGLRKDLQRPSDVRLSLMDCMNLPRETYPLQERLLVESLIRILSELEVAHSASASQRSAIAESTGKMKRAIEQHKLVANDLFEMFAVDPAYVSADGNSLLAYQEGLLKGLPVLSGIPDNIVSLIQLREELVKAGGKITMDSVNPAQEFSQRLDGLTHTSAAIVEAYNLAVQEKEAQNQLLQSEELRITQLALDLRKKIAASLPSAARFSLEESEVIFWKDLTDF